MAKRKGIVDIGELTKEGEKRLDKFWDSQSKPLVQRWAEDPNPIKIIKPAPKKKDNKK